MIVFRYKDKDNYFGVELNGKGAPLKLLKVKEAETTELASVNKISILPEMWYRFLIYFNNQQKNKLKNKFQN